MKVEWFIENLTIQQEFFCWRMALHGIQMRAVREAYGTKGPGTQNTKGWKNMQKPKIVERIQTLIQMHHVSKIDLTVGPWRYYNRKDVGQMIDPGNSVSHIKRKYRD